MLPKLIDRWYELRLFGYVSIVEVGNGEGELCKSENEPVGEVYDLTLASNEFCWWRLGNDWINDGLTPNNPLGSSLP